MCPASWNARIRWSGIARPMWMSGEVTSIPSFTRSGRPSFSFCSRPSAGQHVDGVPRQARRRSIGGLDYPGSGALSEKVTPAQAAAHPQAQTPRPARGSRRCWASASFTVRSARPRSRRRSRSSIRARQQTQANTYVYAANGHTVLAILRGSQARIVVPSERISPWMKHAIVAIEDKRFYEHRGVDLRGMARARLGRRHEPRHRPGRLDDHAAVRQERVPDEPADDRPQADRGGARVAARAALVEGPDPHRLPEHRLLRERRLRRRAGLPKIYFHHGAAQLKPAEAALLAGIPEDPSLWDPVAHPRAREGAAQPRAAAAATTSTT